MIPFAQPESEWAQRGGGGSGGSGGSGLGGLGCNLPAPMHARLQRSSVHCSFTTPWEGGYHWTHFTDEETEVRRSQSLHPTYSWEVTEMDLELQSLQPDSLPCSQLSPETEGK